MCFGGSSPPPPPAVPPPDPAIEAQKYQQFQDSSTRIADEKTSTLGNQRAMVYGLFGRRSLLGDLNSGMLAPGPSSGKAAA